MKLEKPTREMECKDLLLLFLGFVALFGLGAFALYEAIRITHIIQVYGFGKVYIPWP